MKWLWWAAIGAICFEIGRKWLQLVRNDRILSRSEQIWPAHPSNRYRLPPLRLVQGGQRE